MHGRLDFCRFFGFAGLTCSFLGVESRFNLLIKTAAQGRNMLYPRPTDPDFLAVILIPEPPFPQNFDP